MRGKGLREYIQYNFPGITPARAGKSVSAGVCSASRRDHPRACGEKALLPVLEAGLWGSPPRVRGKERRDLPLADLDGITPARAGKSRCA